MTCSSTFVLPLLLLLLPPLTFVDLSTKFGKDLQEFVKSIYDTGQTLLQSHDLKSVDRSAVLSPSTLLIQANIACIELLLWAIREESGEQGKHLRFYNLVACIEVGPIFIQFRLLWG